MAVAAVRPAAASDIDPDEEVVFFPTCASFDAEHDRWLVPVHAWVFEPEEDGLARAATLKLLQESLGLEGERSARFRERAAAFLVDNERGQELEIRLGDRVYGLGESEPNGHLESILAVSRADVPVAPAQAQDADPWVPFELILPAGDDRRMGGRVQLVRPAGISVISDIDDTIKVSEVTDKAALLENTFLEPFESVPGMAQVYAALAERGVVFHYVSASPWQLHAPLAAMLERDGFPRGSMHLKQFRWKDESFFDLFASPEETKMPVLESILLRFPGRRFLLVGDAGERDPEIYGELARRHPEQVMLIGIRSPDEGRHAKERLEQAFRDLAPSRFIVFSDPGELGRRLAGLDVP